MKNKDKLKELEAKRDKLSDRLLDLGGVNPTEYEKVWKELWSVNKEISKLWELK